ncbi:MAG: family 10 glycosylhydrolase [Flavobacterium sp.]|nr:family 10 glycosylhydrolase [Flavobacterium sp.]
MNTYKSLLLLFSIALFSASEVGAQAKIMYPKNEFRAVWIATVANIDWPKNSTDPVEKQKSDFIEILETYKKLHYNAVIVQIRSNGDAFYPSELAPWSRNLTAKEGKAPTPYYDTLEWMIAQAHLRGLEFHAWLNPFRATSGTNKEIISAKHDLNKHPEWMIKYAGKYYYNPALPEVQNHLTKIVEEVVHKYDVDAIHFDDYFYPYTVEGEKFNDTDSFNKYSNGVELADWRRNNVNTFIKQISISIKKIKPWVQFGISPFGVWRNQSVDPRGSDTQAGQTNYDDLFADPLVWMENNWIDYILPQLYWSLDHPKASYTKLLKWWSENSKNAAIYVGNGSYKIKSDADKKWDSPFEIPNQIDYTRSFNNVQGNAFFSAKWFLNKNQEVTQLLAENQYKFHAIPAAVPNFKKLVLDVPRLTSVIKDKNELVISLQPTRNQVRYVVFYGTEANAEINSDDPSQILDKYLVVKSNNRLSIRVPIAILENKSKFALSYIDYFGNESKEITTQLPKTVVKPN